MAKTYKLYCEICNWSEISDDLSKYTELKTSPIPGGSPVYSPEEKKTIFKEAKEQPKKFRCPGCGRVIIPKKYPQNVEKDRSN